jgi:uncharacterized protein (TIGR02598 family)
MSARQASHAAGFSLVEVTLALGIAVFCFVVIFGLLAVGFNTSASAVEQTSATNILASVATDLRTAPTTAASGGTQVTTALYQLSVPVSGNAFPSAAQTKYVDANGQITTYQGAAVTAGSGRYLLTVTGVAGTGRNATQAHIMLSWPAAAPLAYAAGSVEMLVALDRN